MVIRANMQIKSWVFFSKSPDDIRYFKASGHYYPALVNTQPPAFCQIHRNGEYSIVGGRVDFIETLPRNLSRPQRENIMQSIDLFYAK